MPADDKDWTTATARAELLALAASATCSDPTLTDGRFVAKRRIDSRSLDQGDHILPARVYLDRVDSQGERTTTALPYAITSEVTRQRQCSPQAPTPCPRCWRGSSATRRG